MGSFRATLLLGEDEYDVLYSEFMFTRETDKKGKVSSSINAGRIKTRVASTESTAIAEAMINCQFKPINGKIIYKKTDENSKMKEIEFKNGYIVYYKEILDVDNDVPMSIEFTVSAEEIIIGNAAIDNRWPKA
ncbi:type VI secretion system tube protein TssD [Aquimarina rhabdastrellae]